MTEKIKLAVIGVGIMGSSHAHDIANSENVALAAVCDIDPQRAQNAAAQYGVPGYTDYRELIRQEKLDGVLIATPHYFHTPIAIECLQQGLNVLTEKPEAVHAKDAHKMNLAYEEARKQNPNLIYAIMFQSRTYGIWLKLKEMIDGGQLGQLVRATWIVTDWFRSQRYYDNGGWRATWRGEGGGVLLNQCPHNLDLYQWLLGLPQKVTGFAAIGKHHNIEVEDEVTAFFQHENGMVGHFITTTAESPGTNRFELIGDLGKVVVENSCITFTRNEQSMFDFLRTTPDLFTRVPNQVEEVPFTHHGEAGHRLVIENFAAAIRDPSTPLVAHGTEGIRALSLGNAIMLSSWLGHTVDLPLDEDLYEAHLQKLIESSRFQKADEGPGVLYDGSGAYQRYDPK
jgi:predicted dehydrogenase